MENAGLELVTSRRSGSWGSLQLPSNSSCPALTQVWGLFVPHPPKATQIWVCPNADRAGLECGVCECLQASPSQQALHTARQPGPGASWTETSLDCQAFKALSSSLLSYFSMLWSLFWCIGPGAFYPLYTQSSYPWGLMCLSLSEGLVGMVGTSG